VGRENETVAVPYYKPNVSKRKPREKWLLKILGERRRERRDYHLKHHLKGV